MKTLITGGSGSLGRALIPVLKGKVYSLTNNEFEHWEVEKDFGIESFLCDIRDKLRLSDVIDQVNPDVIIHAAALKHVPFGERFPEEFYLTNIIGTENVSEIAKENEIEKCIIISSDKAVNPSCVYGRTKQHGEHIFISNNQAVIRFGNFWGSRGSVIPLWQEQSKSLGYILVTDPLMERYFITLEEAAGFISSCIEAYVPRVIWTPKMKLWTLKELAQEVCPGVPIKVIGNRGNEKMTEELE